MVLNSRRRQPCILYFSFETENALDYYVKHVFAWIYWYSCQGRTQEFFLGGLNTHGDPKKTWKMIFYWLRGRGENPYSPPPVRILIFLFTWSVSSVFFAKWCLVSQSINRVSLPTYLPTYLNTYLSTYLHTYLPTYLPIYLHTYLAIYLHTYLP